MKIRPRIRGISLAGRQKTDDRGAVKRERDEALEQLKATADVLKVISRSPDALQPVFDVIVETSRELCRAEASTIFILRDGRFMSPHSRGYRPSCCST